MVKKVFLMWCSFYLVGCATSYQQDPEQLVQGVYAGNLQNTLIPNPKTENMLFYFEYGSLMQMNQDYTQSNLYWNKAQHTIDLWNNNWRSSTGGHAFSSFENAVEFGDKDYSARDYEKIFLTTQLALNYANLGQFSDVRVTIKKMYEAEEAIKNHNQYTINKAIASDDVPPGNANEIVSALMNTVSDQYNLTELRTSGVLALKNGYQNAFSHYLAGFAFEALGEPDLARPGYVNALELNPGNTFIKNDIHNLDNNKQPQTGYTDLLVVEETGHAPIFKLHPVATISTASLTTNGLLWLSGPNKESECEQLKEAAYPTIYPDTVNDLVYQYSVDNESYTPNLMVNTDLLAKRAVIDQENGWFRHVLPSVMACSASGAMTCLTNSAGENIKCTSPVEKSWVLLPHAVSINRVSLPYGQHSISITVNGHKYTQVITLNQPYQVVSFRVFGDNVYFNLQQKQQ